MASTRRSARTSSWATALAFSVTVALASAFDNSCLLSARELTPPTEDAPTSFLRDCPGWVVNTTDAVWNLPYEEGVLERYFYSDWSSVSSWGRRVRGMDELRRLVSDTRAAFPDLRLTVTDVFCVGNDVDGYKTVMTDSLRGTNTGGPTAYGPVTGRSVTYTGIAVCYVQRVDGEWRYVSEMLLHDERAIVAQLKGEDVDVVEPHHECEPTQPGFGWTPPEAEEKKKEEEAILTEKPNSSKLPYPTDPTSKRVVKAMDRTISEHLYWDNWDKWSLLQQRFWKTDFVYDSVWAGVPNVLANSTGLRQWYDREHIPFNLAFDDCAFSQMIFIGEETTASTTTYANAYWKGDLGRLRPSLDVSTIRICDFYRLDGDRIAYNWMMLDLVDLARRSGHRMLPKPHPAFDKESGEGWVLPPRAMDGLPAPLSRTATPEATERSRRIAAALLRTEFGDGHDHDDDDDYDGAPFWDDEDSVWYGPGGFGVARGREAYLEGFLRPFRAAFPRTSLRVDVLTCQGHFCAAHGHVSGVQRGEWLGTPASGRRVNLRFGCHWHFRPDTGAVRDAYAMFDLPAAFLDMGVDLFDRCDQSVAATIERRESDERRDEATKRRKRTMMK